jgi:hypothetical protein
MNHWVSRGPATHDKEGAAYGAGPTCGQLLRRFRSSAGLTQEELAERCGYSANYIGKLERARSMPFPYGEARLLYAYSRLHQQEGNPGSAAATLGPP